MIALQTRWRSVVLLLLGVAHVFSVKSAQAEEPKNVTFDAIKFEMQKGDPFERKLLTESIEGLVGKKIRLRGWILPTFQTTGLTGFVLVRDNQECCFGPGAALFDCVIVKMEAGHTAEFTTRPISVEGVFDVRELKNPNGSHLAIYHLTADRVR